MEPSEKFAVETLFNDVAPTYDYLNDLLSLGLHRVWKRKLLKLVCPTPGEHWIDICCGTGDLSFALAEKIKPNGSVLAIDNAEKTLLIARDKALGRKRLPISFEKIDALNTNLPSNTFDGGVMSYGLRNLVNPAQGLRELHRLLKPSARAGILDFNPLMKETMQGQFQRIYLRRVVVPLAAKYGLKEHYQYLEESLKSFPSGEKQEELAIGAGFSIAKHHPFAFGQMGLLLLVA